MPRKGTNGTPGDRKYHNLTIDADVHTALLTEQDRLTNQWGFKPSLSQVIKHMVHDAVS